MDMKEHPPRTRGEGRLMAMDLSKEEEDRSRRVGRGRDEGDRVGE
jgi:hypothetical protein